MFEASFQLGLNFLRNLFWVYTFFMPPLFVLSAEFLFTMGTSVFLGAVTMLPFLVPFETGAVLGCVRAVFANESIDPPTLSYRVYFWSNYKTAMIFVFDLFITLWNCILIQFVQSHLWFQWWIIGLFLEIISFDSFNSCLLNSWKVGFTSFKLIPMIRNMIPDIHPIEIFSGAFNPSQKHITLSTPIWNVFIGCYTVSKLNSIYFNWTNIMQLLKFQYMFIKPTATFFNFL